MTFWTRLLLIFTQALVAQFRKEFDRHHTKIARAFQGSLAAASTLLEGSRVKGGPGSSPLSEWRFKNLSVGAPRP